jgi:hypothetical protein
MILPFMLHKLASAAAILLSGLSLFGWGIAVRRFARMPHHPWPVTVALGLAALLFLGGALNLARIAYAPALWALAAAGLAFAIPRVAAATASARSWRLDPQSAMAGGFIAFVAGWTIATQLPTEMFNFHDDFEKYLAHPVRMLDTGTVFGSPLSAAGSETLGGSAFLQAFPISIAGLKFAYAPDAVLGFFLLLCLGAGAGHRRLLPLPGALLVALLIASIEPQIVNLSPVYLGAALMAAVLLLQRLPAAFPSPAFPSPLALGLLYGALIALKPTLGLFAALHLTVLALASGQGFRNAVGFALRTLSWSIAAVAPWLLIHSPHYFRAPVSRVETLSADPHELLRLFSTDPLPYGASAAHYTLLAALAICVAARCLWILRRPSDATDREAAGTLLAAAVAGAGAWLILAIMLAPLLSGYQSNGRYATVFLLGTVPIILGMSGRAGVGGAPHRPAFAIAALAGATLMFWPAVLERVKRAADHESTLAYLSRTTPEQAHARFVQNGITESAKLEVRKLQAFVPPGEAVLIWITQPFHLDFRRNRILDAEPAGLSTYWAESPPEVRYVIWEYEGEVVRGLRDYVAAENRPGRRDRLINARSLAFTQRLVEEVSAGEVLYMDARYAVFRRSKNVGRQ